MKERFVSFFTERRERQERKKSSFVNELLVTGHELEHGEFRLGWTIPVATDTMNKKRDASGTRKKINGMQVGELVSELKHEGLLLSCEGKIKIEYMLSGEANRLVESSQKIA